MAVATMQVQTTQIKTEAPVVKDDKVLLPAPAYTASLQVSTASDSILAKPQEKATAQDRPEFVYNINGSAELPGASGQKRKIIDVIRDGVPSLAAEDANFKPIWFLPDGDLQTMFSVNIGPTEEELAWERKLIMVPDGGNLALDFCPPLASYDKDDKSPIVFMLHGLLGGSHAGYVRSTVQELVKSKEKGGPGYRTVTMTLRGCNGSRITSPHFYHPGMTHDIRSSLLFLNSAAPDVQIFGVGYSLGAGLLTNYLGEMGEKSGFSAGYAVSNVWDYYTCYTEFTSGSLISKLVYNTTLGQRHRVAIYKNRDAFVPPSPSDEATTKLNHRVSVKHSPEALNRIHNALQTILVDPFLTMSTFSREFLAMTSGYETFDEFHTKTSSTQHIKNIKTPLLCITSRDDPLMREPLLPLKEISESSHVVMALTRKGGHLGWFVPASDGTIMQWYTDSIKEFFTSMAEYNPTPGPSARATPPDEFGMVYEDGAPNVGFKVVDQEYVDSIALPEFKAPFSLTFALIEFYLIGPDYLLAGLVKVAQFLTNFGKYFKAFVSFVISLFSGGSSGEGKSHTD